MLTTAILSNLTLPLGSSIPQSSARAQEFLMLSFFSHACLLVQAYAQGREAARPTTLHSFLLHPFFSYSGEHISMQDCVLTLKSLQFIS